MSEKAKLQPQPASLQPEPPATHLTETEALSIAYRFADGKHWQVVEGPTRASFETDRDEWPMDFVTPHHRFLVVCINDKTKKVRYVVGD